MKLISNTLLSFLIALTALVTGEKIHNLWPHKTVYNDTANTIFHTIDSIDNEIRCLNEQTEVALEIDNKIFQNTEKELLYLDLYLDSVHDLNSLETIKNNSLTSIK